MHAYGRGTVTARWSPDGSGAIPGTGSWATGRPDLSPRCGGPVAIYETAGAAVPGKYDETGRAIRRARKQAGMTQAQLAEAVGTSGLKVISDWENGRRYPRKGAAALEEVLGIRLPGPRCGRPEGHRGPCRPLEAVAAYYRADVDRHRRAARNRRALAGALAEQARERRAAA